MRITGGSALSKDEIDRMVREAEQYAAEDAKRREQVETRNQADSLVYQTEKFLEDNGDKIPDDVKGEVQADLDALKKVLDNADSGADEIQAAVTKLGETSQKMGAAMYAAAEADQSAAGGSDGSTGESDDDVVDAEIIDEDDADGRPTGTPARRVRPGDRPCSRSRWTARSRSRRPRPSRPARPMTTAVIGPARSATPPPRWPTRPRSRALRRADVRRRRAGRPSRRASSSSSPSGRPTSSGSRPSTSTTSAASSATATWCARTRRTRP